VGDFHGRRATRRVAIERQQPLPPERIEDGVEVFDVDARLFQLRSSCPPPSVGTLVVHVDEPQEQPTRGVLLTCGQRSVDVVGLSTDGARKPAGLEVRGERDRVRRSSFEEVGHHMLHDRE
jgi:hypothetical protein